ncbi:MAG: hypothetical protein ACAI38_07855 [Myxococcota bacterium]|nr:hypothetical protein [Myxococcota bacterium]
MESIFEATADRRTRDRRRRAFSWGSFYAGVGVALGVMLMAYKLVPQGGLAGLEREKALPAIAVQRADMGSDGADDDIANTAFVSRSSNGRMTPTQLARLIESGASNENESAALRRLRLRGNAPMNGFDRDNAVAAFVDRTGSSREEAQGVVDGWISRGR